MVLIPLTHSPYMLVGKSPERDHEIDLFCETIRNVAKAGIPILQYYFTLVGVPRSGWKPVRGGARGGAFVYEEAKEDPPLTEAGPVSAEQYWERITYVLKRVVPVAEEYKTRICCHPHDPAMPRGKTWRVSTASSRIRTRSSVFWTSPPANIMAAFLPGHGVGDARRPRQGNLRRNPPLWPPGQDLQRSLPQHQGPARQFRGDLLDDGDVDMLEAARTYKEVATTEC
jgi:mannonate dehydratase